MAVAQPAMMRSSQGPPPSWPLRLLLVLATVGPTVDAILLYHEASHLRGHNTSLGATNTSLPLYAYDEIEVAEKAKFVQSCFEIVNMADPNLLPMRAMREFCDGTNAVVECRLKLETGLKAAHGSSDSLRHFCDDAWDWAASKYGSQCETQCSKLQCKATCLWIKKKRDLERSRSDLEAGSEFAALAWEEVRKANVSLQELQRHGAELVRLAARAEDTVKRAETKVMLGQAAFDEAKNEYDRQKAAISLMVDVHKEASCGTLSAAAKPAVCACLDERNKELAEHEFEVESLTQKMKASQKLETALQRALQRAEEKVERLPSVQAGQAQLQNQTKMVAAAMDAVNATTLEISNYVKSIEQRQNAVLDAKQALDDASSSAADDDPDIDARALRALEDHLAETQRLHDLAMRDLDELIKKRELQNDTVKEGHRRLGLMHEEQRALEEERRSAINEVVAIKRNISEREEEREEAVHDLEENLVAARKVVADDKVYLAKFAEAFRVLGERIDLARRWLEEVGAGRVKPAREALGGAREELKAANRTHLEALENITKNAEQITEQDAKVETMRLKAIKDYGEISDEKFEEQRTAERELSASMPEIVRQHNLGLVRVFWRSAGVPPSLPTPRCCRSA